MRMVGFDTVENIIAELRLGHLRSLFMFASSSAVALYAVDACFCERIRSDVRRVFEQSQRVQGTISISGRIKCVCVCGMSKQHWRSFTRKAIAESSSSVDARAFQGSEPRTTSG